MLCFANGRIKHLNKTRLSISVNELDLNDVSPMFCGLALAQVPWELLHRNIEEMSKRKLVEDDESKR